MFESLVSTLALFVREREESGKWFVGRECNGFLHYESHNVLRQYIKRYQTVGFLIVDEYNAKILCWL